MARYIDVDKLIEFANNTILMSIDANDIARFPTEDVAPIKHGHWKEVYDKDGDPFFRRKFYCSVCNDWQTYGELDYCPNCGAKMDGKGKNNGKIH